MIYHLNKKKDILRQIFVSFCVSFDLGDSGDAWINETISIVLIFTFSPQKMNVLLCARNCCNLTTTLHKNDFS